MDQKLHAARACEDAGITALGGGDYDGDDLHVAADSALINLSQTEESEQSGRSKNRVTEQNGQTVLCSFAPLRLPFAAPFSLLPLLFCSTPCCSAFFCSFGVCSLLLAVLALSLGSSMLLSAVLSKVRKKSLSMRGASKLRWKFRL